MLWLQSNERHEDVAALDTTTGRYEVWKRQALGATAPQSCDGYFSSLSGTFAAIYREPGGALVFRLGDAAYPLTDDTLVQVSGPAERRVLVVKVKDIEVATHSYHISGDDQFQDDPTPFVEPEDFDLGLYAANLSQDKSRRDQLSD